MNKQWYAIYTKPRWEKKVAALMLKAGLEHYLPLRKEMRIWTDRKKMVEMPVLSSYLFVCIDDQQKTEVRMVPGVVNFVYYNHKLAQVHNDEIEAMKLFLQEEGTLTIEHQYVKVGNVIQFNKHPFKQQRATIQLVKPNLIELLMHTLQVKLTIKKPTITKQ
jgi:transcription antitermination factor NusG